MKQSLLIFLTIIAVNLSYAQQLYCPPNIDFENGNLDQWQFYIGTCCPIIANNSTQALVDRHTLQTGNATDPYGLFPVVAPGGGNYSIKLGNNQVGAEAERATYTFTIPAGLNNYSLIYQYAVVFEDPDHDFTEQPRFEVKIYSKDDNAILPCAYSSYVSGAGLPGFKVSISDPQVLYRDWATASIDLSGYAGKTLVAEFSTGDCLLGGHFGYGYVDVSCALFQADGVYCNNDSVIQLSAPPGFDQYQWYDSTFTNLLATGQQVNLPGAGGGANYKVILSPFPGFGCPDTLDTKIFYSDLKVNVAGKLEVCNRDSLHMSALAEGTSPHFYFEWMPGVNLSCSNCTDPTVFPMSEQHLYTLTVTDDYGCKVENVVAVTPTIKACCSDIFIPDAFTPNQDGLNDAFRVKSNLDIDVKDWSVFNRWGQKLWSSTRYYDSWDGTYEKEAQQMGVYFYIFTYECMSDHKIYTKKGDITLIR
jgi:gliding motility-associated-like protein